MSEQIDTISTIFNNTNENIVHLKEFIRAQIEYYFSDSNLLYDVHMQKLLSSNKKGYVELKEFMKFNKIKKALSKFSNHQGIKLKVIELSLSNSEFLKLNSKKKKVRRITPWIFSKEIIESFKEKKRKRTIYVENFSGTFTEKDLFEIFQKIGDINTIDLAKDRNSNFGYCFIEFKNENMAISALGMNNYVPLKLMEKSNGEIQPLKVMSYFYWRTFKNKINKIIQEQNIYKQKPANLIYVCLKIKKEFYGITKKEIMINLRQIKARPIDIDIYEYDKIVITLDIMAKFNHLCDCLKEEHELTEFFYECYPLLDQKLQKYKEHINYMKFKLEKKKSIKKLTLNKFV